MKRLLQHLLILFVLLSPAQHAVAQEDELPPLSEERMKEIKAQKTAYLTTKMELSPEESQKFWPVYNQYDKEIEAVRKDRRDARRAVKQDADITDAEADAIIEKELANQQRELDIRKKYSAEFKKVIGARKTMLLAKAERDFLRELLGRLRDRREGGGGPGRGPGGRR